jgi:4-amino-4-deoxy-L-arabinose transferase-like glycosyltransferase
MPENTKTAEVGSRPIPNFVWAIFAVLTALVYFCGLNLPFVGPDEPRYAQVAREMLQRGDWITPTLGGFHWFEKPVLLYWMEMAGYKMFGVTEFAARLGPALCGLGIVICLWFLGRTAGHASTDEQRPTISFSNWLALIGASTLGIIVFAHGASFDIVVAFSITAALTSYLIYEQKGGLWSLAGFYFFVGVSLLAKGLIGILFPYAIVGFYNLISRKLPSRTVLLSVVWGSVLAFAVAAIWYLPMYWRHGWEFIDEFIVQQHFQRFTSNKYQHPQPFYFYLWVLPLMTLPWLPFSLAGLWRAVGDLFHPKRTEDTEIAEVNTDKSQPSRVSTSTDLPFPSSPLLRLAVAWLLVPLVFFSFSGSKLPGYILPAVPAAIILATILIFGLVSRSVIWSNAIMSIAGVTLAGILTLLHFAAPQYAEEHSVRSLFDAASQNGYTTNRVLTLRTISMNSEFYAAGRLLKDRDGKQRWLDGVDHIESEIKAQANTSVLVIVPIEHVSQLTGYPNFDTRVLKDNGDLAIVAVTLRPPA